MHRPDFGADGTKRGTLGHVMAAHYLAHRTIDLHGYVAVGKVDGGIIDAGKSPEGWSTYGRWQACPYFFGIEKWYEADGALWLTNEPLPPPVIDLEPVVLVNHDEIAPWEEAGLEWCNRTNNMRFYDRMHDVVQKGIVDRTPGYHVLSVETLGRLDIVRRKDRLRAVTAGTRLPDDEPVTLDMPGHPKHGWPVFITRRKDIELTGYDPYRDEPSDLVYVIDHKFYAKFSPGRTHEAERPNGGTSVYQIMGQQEWGEQWGGLRIHEVETINRCRAEYVPIPNAPERERRFARNLVDIWHDLARVELELLRGERTVDELRPAASPTICHGVYGACHLLRSGQAICAYGRGTMA